MIKLKFGNYVICFGLNINYKNNLVKLKKLKNKSVKVFGFPLNKLEK